MSKRRITVEEVRAFCAAFARACERVYEGFADFKPATFAAIADPKAHPLAVHEDPHEREDELERRVAAKAAVEAGLDAAMALRRREEVARRKPRVAAARDDLPPGLSYATQQEIRPQRTPGVDHGSRALILVRRRDEPSCCMLWCKAHMSWGGVGCDRDYNAVSLRLMRSPRQLKAIHHYDRNDLFGVELQEGGRLTRKAIAAHLEKIAAHFDVKDFDPAWVDFRRTLIVP